MPLRPIANVDTHQTSVSQNKTTESLSASMQTRTSVGACCHWQACNPVVDFPVMMLHRGARHKRARVCCCNPTVATLLQLPISSVTRDRTASSDSSSSRTQDRIASLSATKQDSRLFNPIPPQANSMVKQWLTGSASNLHRWRRMQGAARKTHERMGTDLHHNRTLNQNGTVTVQIW